VSSLQEEPEASSGDESVELVEEKMEGSYGEGDAAPSAKRRRGIGSTPPKGSAPQRAGSGHAAVAGRDGSATGRRPGGKRSTGPQMEIVPHAKRPAGTEQSDGVDGNSSQKARQLPKSMVGRWWAGPQAVLWGVGLLMCGLLWACTGEQLWQDV